MYQQQLAQNEQGGNYTSSATKELDDLMASLSDFKVSARALQTEANPAAYEWNNNKFPRRNLVIFREWFPNHQIWGVGANGNVK